jgi:GAF domain-containing protein
VTEDAGSDRRFAADLAKEPGYEPNRIVAVPLQTERGVIGVLEVLDPAQEGTERGLQLDLVGLLADEAALAIENARTFRELGNVLFAAIAQIAAREDRDLADSLRAVTEEASGPTADLAELAEVFAELGEVGNDERRLVTDVSVSLLRYLRAARRVR